MKSPAKRQIRYSQGVPSAALFSDYEASPIVIDTETGHAYYLNGGNVVRALIPRLSHAAFLALANQTAASINTGNAIVFDEVALQDEIFLVSSRRLTVTWAGTYEVEYSLQLVNTNSSAHSLYVWLRKNGVDIPKTNTKFTLAGSGAALGVAASFMVEMNEEDYIEIMWAVDSLNLSLGYIASPPAGPAIPAAVVDMFQVN